jgi:hypothetical protein
MLNTMELIVVLLVILGLAALAPVLGADSRDLREPAPRRRPGLW